MVRVVVRFSFEALDSWGEMKRYWGINKGSTSFESLD
jgi:hypothetical protein